MELPLQVLSEVKLLAPALPFPLDLRGDFAHRKMAEERISFLGVVTEARRELIQESGSIHGADFPTEYPNRCDVQLSKRYRGVAHQNRPIRRNST
jgi:hypothetical protein